jgi:trk system potassium uptake protein TrkH
MVNGLFESMSAFTTTGSCIFTESNAQGYWIINKMLANQSIAAGLAEGMHQLLASKALNNSSSYINAITNISKEETYFGLLFWRSFAQWLGGMGIILLFIAVLPKLGVAGRQLYKAEVPGPDKDALTPHIGQTAKLLWWVYVLLTIAEVLLLVLAGMPLYLCIYGHRRILPPGSQHSRLQECPHRWHNYLIYVPCRGQLRFTLQDALLRQKELNSRPGVQVFMP